MGHFAPPAARSATPITSGPGASEKLRGIGADPVTGSPEQFGALIRNEIERWGKLVREAGIKPG